MKRRLWKTLSAAAVLGALALAVTAAMVYQESRQDQARAADVIVVLGAAEYRGKPSPALRLRLDHALELYRNHMADRILVTGGSGLNSRFTEAETARDYLVRQDVPSEHILLETGGTSTWQSLTAAAEILRMYGWRRVLVVSDGYHLFRARRMLHALGFDVYGSPRRPVATAGHPWVYFREAAGFWLWSLNLAS